MGGPPIQNGSECLANYHEMKPNWKGLEYKFLKEEFERKHNLIFQKISF